MKTRIQIDLDIVRIDVGDNADSCVDWVWGSYELDGCETRKHTICTDTLPICSSACLRSIVDLAYCQDCFENRHPLSRAADARLCYVSSSSRIDRVESDSRWSGHFGT